MQGYRPKGNKTSKGLNPPKTSTSIKIETIKFYTVEEINKMDIDLLKLNFVSLQGIARNQEELIQILQKENRTLEDGMNSFQKILKKADDLIIENEKLKKNQCTHNIDNNCISKDILKEKGYILQ